MTGGLFSQRHLTNAATRQAVLLTLALCTGLFVLLAARLSHAGNVTDPADADTRIRLNQAESYIRKQGLHGLSLLPNEVREAAGWFSGWHQFQFFAGEDKENAGPADSVSEPKEADSGLSFPLATSIHHKGFLPTHDAMMMGVGASQKMAGDKMLLTARPFYGQSWHSLGSYWGGEVALDVAQHADGMPWGKISAGYVNGEESLTDHGRGIDVHGDIDLTHHVTLTTGMRQNSISGDGNYTMLSWKISFGGNP